MPFSPYHSFRNEATLLRLLDRLRAESNLSEVDYFKFHRYHSALIHKLKSAKYHLDQLSSKLTNTDLQEVANTSGSFLFEINMFIDGYFYNCGSALDILARELLVIFNENFPQNVYFDTAHRILSSSRSTDSILPKILTPAWKREFSNYRNALTHELLIAPTYSITIENHGPSQTHIVIFPLPDDPRSDFQSRTYAQNKDVLKYIEENFKRVLRLVNGIYNEVYIRARDGHSLPL